MKYDERKPQTLTKTVDNIDLIRVSLGDLLEQIQSHIQRYGSDALVERSDDDVVVLQQVLETDAEFQRRMTVLDIRETNERKQYLALKAKFEGVK